MTEPIKPEVGETASFEYNKKENQVHYTESRDTIEVRLVSEPIDENDSAQAMGELIAVIDKKTHWIEQDNSAVTLRFVPVS